MKIIFVASVMGTGTKFTLGFFEASPVVSEKVDLRAAMVAGDLKRGTINLVHGHVDGNAPCSLDALRSFAVLCDHFVIPIRDPLAVMLLAQRRKTPREVLKGFLDLQMLDLHYRPEILPVDLLAAAKPGVRLAALKRVSDFYVPRKVCEEWADKWPVINSQGSYPLKRMYQERDVAAIRKAIPPERWDDLRGQEPYMRPFLEGLGYENLMWWS